MPLRKIIFLLLISGAIQHSLIAQTAVKPGAITKVAKFKPPVVQTFLGRNINGATVTIEEANQLINLPLKIANNKNKILLNIYMVLCGAKKTNNQTSLLTFINKTKGQIYF